MGSSLLPLIDASRSQRGTSTDTKNPRKQSHDLEFGSEKHWLVVEPTHWKNIRQIGSFPQIGMKIENI